MFSFYLLKFILFLCILLIDILPFLVFKSKHMFWFSFPVLFAIWH